MNSPARMTTPRFHTPRTPGSKTMGGRAARVAAMLGKPLIPWQRRAVDVALELDDNGRFRYHTIVITVPRQSGKSTVSLDLALHRALITPGGKVWFTAQTGQAARERFLDELGRPAAALSPSLFRLNRGAGDTRLSIPALDSQIRPHPPTEDYLHGEQSDLNLIDEPWAYGEDQAAALMQAIIPTQATRPNAQTILLSTAGTAESTWWHRQVEEARAGKPGVAIIDYGIGPDVDPTDVEAVIAAHPAVGHTIGPDAVWAAATTLTPAEFARGYGNVPTVTATALVDDDVIAALMTDEPIPDDAPVAIAAAVGWGQESTAIVAVADVGGVPVVEVIDARPGTSWAAGVIADIARAQSPAPVVIDRVGPSATLHDEVAAAGIELADVTARDLAAGTEDVLARIRRRDDAGPAPAIRFRRDDALATELRGAATRVMGDTGTAWSRKRSAVPIPRLEAATLAVRTLFHGVEQSPAPMIWTP